MTPQSLRVQTPNHWMSICRHSRTCRDARPHTLKRTHTRTHTAPRDVQVILFLSASPSCVCSFSLFFLSLPTPFVTRLEKTPASHTKATTTATTTHSSAASAAVITPLEGNNAIWHFGERGVCVVFHLVRLLFRYCAPSSLFVAWHFVPPCPPPQMPIENTSSSWAGLGGEEGITNWIHPGESLNKRQQ